MRVLVSISDGERRRRVEESLVANGHELGEPPCDLVITDDVAACEKLRAARPAQAILVITPSDDVEARVRSLRAGADDALSEPYAPSQMAARVDALGRRARLVPSDPQVLEVDGCRIDLSALKAHRQGNEIALTAREAAILAWLHRHRGRAVPRSELLEHVWRVAPTLDTRTVDVTIANLRKKIEADPSRPAIIVGVKNVGYTWGS